MKSKIELLTKPDTGEHYLGTKFKYGGHSYEVLVSDDEVALKGVHVGDEVEISITKDGSDTKIDVTLPNKNIVKCVIHEGGNKDEKV